MKRIAQPIIFLLSLLIFTSVYGLAYSADQESTRIRIGLKLFRAIIAADTQIQSKRATDGKLAFAIIYKNNAQKATLYTEMLQNLGKGDKRGRIKGIPIRVDSISVDQLGQLSTINYAGLYFVEEIENLPLQTLINYAIKQQIISYSPFEGDVEKGVSAGLSVGARVKPYVNVSTLKRSGLQLKPFFLKVSKSYAP
ncbi:MAG: hypothetical protein GQ582_00705 [Methyloprofundus sp.]|nr:hypothetical protein [Methyloprofundus sp.]